MLCFESKNSLAAQVIPPNAPHRRFLKIEYEKVMNMSSHYSTEMQCSLSFAIEHGADNDKASDLRGRVPRCVRAGR